MAEISLEEAQEQKQLRSRISPFSAKAGPVTPITNTGVPESFEIQLWNKVADGIGVGGAIAENWQQNSAKAQAHGIKREMDADHEDQMLKMVENLHQTPLEHLDYKDTVIGFNERHDADFRIGALNDDGNPSVTIKDKSIDDYELPWRQEENLKEYYNELDDKKKEYILNELPGIMQQKIDMIIADTSQELYTEASALFNNRGSYVPEETSIDEEGVDWATIKDQERTIELGEDPQDIALSIKVGGQDEYIYTQGLNGAGLEKLRGIMTKFDKQLMDLMSTGAISSQKAIAYQRGFTQEVLQRQFQIESSRDPDGTYLKVINNDYYIDRNLMWDTKENEIRQKITLNDVYTRDWMANVHASRRTKHDQDMAALSQEGFAQMQEEVYDETETREYMLNPNNTRDDVKAALVNAGMDPSEASAKARGWSLRQIAVIDGVKAVAHNNTVSMLEQAFINDAEAMTQLLGDPKSDTLVIAKDPKKLKKILSGMLEKQLDEDKKGIDKPEMLHKPLISAKERREYIEYGVSKIQRSHIQQFINHHIANNRDNEKTLYAHQLLSKGETVGGRQELADEFFNFDEEKGVYSIDPDKINNHENRQYYSSDEEFAIPLMGVMKDLNSKEAAYRKANTEDRYLSQEQFKTAMMDFAQTHKMMMGSEFKGVQYDGLWADPNRKHEDPFHAAVYNWAKKDKTGYLTDVLEKEGINGLLTPNQRKIIHRDNASFQQMAVWLSQAKPDANKGRSYLEGIYKELMHGKKKSHYHGTYTGAVGKLLSQELAGRISKLMPGKLIGTIDSDCSEMGQINDNCVLKKKKAYGITSRKVGQETVLYANGEKLATVTEADIEETMDLIDPQSSVVPTTYE